MNGSERPVIWVGSSRRDLRCFPRAVRRARGVPHTQVEVLKAALTPPTYRIVNSSDFKSTEAGKILGLKPLHASALMRTRPGSPSVDPPTDYPPTPGQNVQITVTSARKKH